MTSAPSTASLEKEWWSTPDRYKSLMQETGIGTLLSVSLSSYRHIHLSAHGLTSPPFTLLPHICPISSFLAWQGQAAGAASPTFTCLPGNSLVHPSIHSFTHSFIPQFLLKEHAGGLIASVVYRGPPARAARCSEPSTHEAHIYGRAGVIMQLPSRVTPELLQTSPEVEVHVSARSFCRAKFASAPRISCAKVATRPDLGSFDHRKDLTTRSSSSSSSSSCLPSFLGLCHACLPACLPAACPLARLSVFPARLPLPPSCCCCCRRWMSCSPVPSLLAEEEFLQPCKNFQTFLNPIHQSMKGPCQPTLLARPPAPKRPNQDSFYLFLSLPLSPRKSPHMPWLPIPLQQCAKRQNHNRCILSSMRPKHTGHARPPHHPQRRSEEARRKQASWRFIKW